MSDGDPQSMSEYTSRLTVITKRAIDKPSHLIF